MKKHLSIVIWASVLIIGLSVLLYPSASDLINSRRQYRAVYKYFEIKSDANDKETEELLAVANNYNRELYYKSNRFSFTEEEMKEYQQTLVYRGSDVLGVIEIERIDINLPIYHGTGESVLQSGAGHLEGSSLPVGGPGTHSVITGHRGLPSSTLFTNLDRLVIGDMFALNVLNEVLIYQVDQITVVLPDDARNLGIEPDKDYCTLLTCTPYGINTHRLLVRGSRVPNTLYESSGETIRQVQIIRINNTPAVLLMITLASIRFAKYFLRNKKIIHRARNNKEGGGK